MKKYLISPSQKQYKANLHSHSTLSDGKLTPEALCDAYHKAGYSVLAITDHEVPASHEDLSRDDFVVLTGYECYIRPDPMGKNDPYSSEIHLNLYAEDPKNETLICFNEHYAKYLRQNGITDTVKRVGSERERNLSPDYVNEYIKTANENGYIVAYNHPVWSGQTDEEILAYRGLFSLEIANNGANMLNSLEYSGALYNRMLSRGERVFCHASDDNHNYFENGDQMGDSFGAYTMILADTLSYQTVFEAMRAGNMYASRGPEIYSLSVEGNTVGIICSEAEHIVVYTGRRSPVSRHRFQGEKLTGAEIEIPSDARYIRVSVIDKYGRTADTRGYFPEEYK